MRDLRTPGYFFGLDLGQAADYSALAILERQPRATEAEPLALYCRHLQRWPLRTPYPAIVADTVGMLESGALLKGARRHLAVDATGVGAPVVDLFKAERCFQRNGGPVILEAVQITGGDRVTREGGLTRVPKRDLVTTAQVALQTRRLKIAPELPEGETLRRELQNFRVKINIATAHDSYEAWREGEHDDLVLAVSLAAWGAEHGRGPRPVIQGTSVTSMFR